MSDITKSLSVEDLATAYDMVTSDVYVRVFDGILKEEKRRIENMILTQDANDEHNRGFRRGLVFALKIKEVIASGHRVEEEEEV